MGRAGRFWLPVLGALLVVGAGLWTGERLAEMRMLAGVNTGLQVEGLVASLPRGPSPLNAVRIRLRAGRTIANPLYRGGTVRIVLIHISSLPGQRSYLDNRDIWDVLITGLHFPAWWISQAPNPNHRQIVRRTDIFFDARSGRFAGQMFPPG